MGAVFRAIHSTVIKRSLFAILVLAAVPLPVMAQSTGGRSVVRLGYETLRDALYNSEPLHRIEALYQGASDALESADLPETDRLLWLSRIEYMAARGYQANDVKEQSISHYESGLAALSKLRPDQVSSESWRMTSECVSQLCLLKSTAYVIANGPKVAAYAEKALTLDPKNAAARIIIAASKVYPPPVFGGNPRRGIELMQEALTLGTAERDDLFNIYSGIGLAYGKLKNDGEARRWLGKALELYPGNLFARTEYAKLAGEP
jgi:tetratricopeptide (TPR) repeat protein